MRKSNDNEKKAVSSPQVKAPAGKKFAVTPKKGEMATKKTEILGSSKDMVNGPYIPQKMAAAKKATPAPTPNKTKYKAPSNKQVFGNSKAHNNRIKRTPKCR